MRFKAVKHQNEDVYKNIEVIENALKNKRQISFNYYHIDENKNKVYSHDKKLYIEEPIGAVLDDGNYYLLCYRTQNEYTNNLKIFRIDRIDGISVIEREISKRAETVLKKSEKIKMQAFKMYGGEVKEVTLQFTPDLIGVIYDKFGYGTKIRRNNEICRATVEVQVSPTFWGWMMQFPTKMKIYFPENLKRQYIELVKSAL